MAVSRWRRRRPSPQSGIRRSSCTPRARTGGLVDAPVQHYSCRAMDASGQIELDDAVRMVLDALTPLASETFELDSALGRVLAQDIVAERPLPPFDGSAMDGFAVRAADVAGARDAEPVVLRLVDESRAGHPA